MQNLCNITLLLFFKTLYFWVHAVKSCILSYFKLVVHFQHFFLVCSLWFKTYAVCNKLYITYTGMHTTGPDQVPSPTDRRGTQGILFTLWTYPKMRHWIKKKKFISDQEGCSKTSVQFSKFIHNNSVKYGMGLWWNRKTKFRMCLLLFTMRTCIIQLNFLTLDI